jgi:hypothetical protein
LILFTEIDKLSDEFFPLVNVERLPTYPKDETPGLIPISVEEAFKYSVFEGRNPIDGVNENSEYLYTPEEAGLILKAPISPPSEMNALPIAEVLALP